MALARNNRGTSSVAYALNTNASVTSASFSPVAGALLVVILQEVTTDTSMAVTMSSTFTGQGAWTKYTVNQNDGYGNMIDSHIAWSVCGSAPGAGTVTATARAGTFNSSYFMEVIEVTGQAPSPIAQSITNYNSASTSLALNFALPPNMPSYCFFGANMNGTTTGVAAPGTTLGSFDMASGNFAAKHAEKLGLGFSAQNNSYTGGSGGSVNSGVGIEVAQSTGGSLTKRWGGIPFAGISQKGQW